MHSSLTITLILALLACPAFCGADVTGYGSCGHDDARSAAPDPCQQDGRCPEEPGENCICGGAVQADVVRVQMPDLVGLPTYLPVPIGLGPLPLLALPNRERSPSGLSCLGDQQRVRPFLQVYIC